MSSGFTLSRSRLTKFLTFAVKESPDSIRQKLFSATCIHLILLVTKQNSWCDHRATGKQATLLEHTPHFTTTDRCSICSLESLHQSACHSDTPSFPRSWKWHCDTLEWALHPSPAEKLDLRLIEKNLFKQQNIVKLFNNMMQIIKENGKNLNIKASMYSISHVTIIMQIRRKLHDINNDINFTRWGGWKKTNKLLMIM